MIKEYWLYLEPYIFIWSDENDILLYNTLSKRSYTYKLEESIKNFISELKDESNLYCISISDTDLNNLILSNFVYLIRSSFCGDIIDKRLHPHKPLIIYPLLNLNDDIYRDINTINNNEKYGRKIVNNLTDVSIYLGGKCNYNCKYCNSKFKQIKWCTMSSISLEFNELNFFYPICKFHLFTLFHFMEEILFYIQNGLNY